MPLVNVPTPVVRAEVALLVVTKALDSATTYLVVENPLLFESVPFTRVLVEALGPLAGVTVAAVFGVVGVVAVAEFGYRFCAGARRRLRIEESPLPCAAQHTAYVFSSALFAAAFARNLSLLG